jgi:RNA polymerase sigma-70 factor (ECF subfamily)
MASSTSKGEPHVRAEPTFREVYAAHARFVWRTLRRLGVRGADLEDVCQEVFMVLSRKISQLDLSTSPRGWLSGVCVRVALDYRRRAHVRREVPTDTLPELDAPATEPAALDRRRARAQLDEILDRLDAEKRAVFVLYELEQLPMVEVAAAVGCPLQTAYSRLHAARRHVEAAVHKLQRRSEESGRVFPASSSAREAP